MTLPKLKDGTDLVLRRFLSEKLRKAGAKGYVLGVSGGIDSAVVLKLAVESVGAKKVMALIMPERDSPSKDMEDARELCNALKVSFREIDITEMVDAFRETVDGRPSKMALANAKARCRMILLYHFAGTERRLVLGTSNKSELLVGYFTKYGDGGADLEPIGDLYKTEVRELARIIGIPDGIVSKAPSAGLWKGQTDEEEMGITYDKLDAILSGVERGLDDKAIASEAGTSIKEVERIVSMVRLSSHKRKLPPVAKVGLRTPGLDWREGDEDV
jgi:NAD+ synthase